MTYRTALALVVAAWAVSGCLVDYPDIGDLGNSPDGASSSNGAGGAPNGSSGAGAGNITGSGAGMQTSSGTTNPNDCEDPDELCLPQPTSGIQIMSIGETIQPGEDVEYCEVVELPGDSSTKYYVNRMEVAMTNHSHHLIIAGVIPGSQTDANAQVGDKRNCVTPSVYGEDLVPVSGSQHPYHEETFPQGVGRVYEGGQKLIFDYHYFNSSSEPLQAQGALNMHTVDPSEITNIAESFGMYNLGIFIPPNATQSFTKTCTFSHDVMVYKLTRHTHQWGTNFDVRFAGGSNDGQMVWTSPDYEETDYLMPQPTLMPAGSGFEFTCNFNNTTSNTLMFGTSATDEMCILFGTWYRVNPNDSVPEQGCFSL